MIRAGFLEVGPLRGKRYVAVADQNTGKDRAGEIKQIMSEIGFSVLKSHASIDVLPNCQPFKLKSLFGKIIEIPCQKFLNGSSKQIVRE